MAHKKSDRPLALVGFSVGGVLATILAVGTENSPLSDLVPSPIQYSVTNFEPAQAGIPATLQIDCFGIWTYTRTAPTPDGFNSLTRMLDIAPTFVFIAFGAALGAVCAIKVVRRGKRSEDTVSNLSHR